MKENFDLKMEHSDIMGQKSINTIFYEPPKEHVLCPKCGGVADLDPEILTSNPPQRRIRCPHCGLVTSEFCHNLHIFYGDEPKSPWIIDGTLPDVKATYMTKCIICGDRISVNAMAQEPSAHVCENCRRAILKLRKMLEDDND